jgi:putative transcriptional regulator
MAERRMTNKRLSELMGVHPNAVSRLKNQDILPHIGGETLDILCQYLDCALLDLVEYIPSQSGSTQAAAEHQVRLDQSESTSNASEFYSSIRRLAVPLSEQDTKLLKKLAQIEERSAGKMAQRLIREGLERVRAEGKI